MLYACQLLVALAVATQGAKDLSDYTVKPSGATNIEAKAGSVRFTVGANEEWPGVLLTPTRGRWDLSAYTGIEVDVQNEGAIESKVACRVDNAGADGNRRCNTEAITIAPTSTATVRVTFGKSWGGVGATLDRSKIVGVLVFVDHPASEVRLSVLGVRAVGSFAELPRWLGQRPPVPGQWRRTFTDEFEGSLLDAKKWTPRLTWNGPLASELQVYSQKNVSVSGGSLRIRCEKRRAHLYEDPTLPEREYTTGCAISYDKFTQRYGYFEARLKFPRARGMWPAFWMMPDRGSSFKESWQRRDTGMGDGMEIDIAEHLSEWGEGHHNVAVHYDGYDKDHKSLGSDQVLYPPTRDGFHVAGLLWEPGKLTWFVDGKQVWEWSNPRVCSVPMYLKFTVQTGGWATKEIDDEALPDEFLVDYVRVWQRS